MIVEAVVIEADRVKKHKDFVRGYITFCPILSISSHLRGLAL